MKVNGKVYNKETINISPPKNKGFVFLYRKFFIECRLIINKCIALYSYYYIYFRNDSIIPNVKRQYAKTTKHDWSCSSLYINNKLEDFVFHRSGCCINIILI